MCIAKEIRLMLSAKVFIVRAITQGTEDLSFTVGIE
jgi:hypothetical protein